MKSKNHYYFVYMSKCHSQELLQRISVVKTDYYLSSNVRNLETENQQDRWMLIVRKLITNLHCLQNISQLYCPSSMYML